MWTPRELPRVAKCGLPGSCQFRELPSCKSIAKFEVCTVGTSRTSLELPSGDFPGIAKLQVRTVGTSLEFQSGKSARYGLPRVAKVRAESCQSPCGGNRSPKVRPYRVV